MAGSLFPSRRPRARLFLVALAFALPLAAATILGSKHRDAGSFKRISEYFTGEENSGRYIIFRSDPERRTGHYVALRLEDKGDFDRLATVRVRYFEPGSLVEQTVEIPNNAEGRSGVLLVGLTGPRWEDDDARPLAWRIELLAANGAIIDAAESFLWSAEQP